MCDNDPMCSVNSSDSDSHMLNAEFSDGQLRIVEVTQFDNDKDMNDDSMTLQNIMQQESCDSESNKIMHELDPRKSLNMQLDLLNLTLVRCEDNEGTYRLVANDSNYGQGIDETTVTVQLESDDVAAQMQSDPDTYVMIEGDDGETMILHTYEESNDDQPQEDTQENKDSDEKQFIDVKSHLEIELRESDNDDKNETQSGDGDEKRKKSTREFSQTELFPKTFSSSKLTPVEILEKVKALQKTRALISRPVSFNKRGRKRKSEVPSPEELLASPNLKLYLYSCKLCNYKCNAVKDLKEHRTTEHSKLNKKHKPFFEAYQCDKCPNRYTSESALEDHINKTHNSRKNESLSLDSIGVSEVDILVCGACGFESPCRLQFKLHIEKEHQASTNFVNQLLLS